MRIQRVRQAAYSGKGGGTSEEPCLELAVRDHYGYRDVGPSGAGPLSELGSHVDRAIVVGIEKHQDTTGPGHTVCLGLDDIFQLTSHQHLSSPEPMGRGDLNVPYLEVGSNAA